MNIEYSRVTLHLRDPFTIARRAPRTETEVIHVRIGAGIGEAAPQPYYGETVETVEIALARYIEALADLDDDAPIETVAERMKTTLGGHPSARAAIEAALWDRLGRRLNAPLWRLWGLDPANVPPTSYTIGLGTTEAMQKKARDATNVSILKVKLGTPDDIGIVRALREVTDKPIRVDANTAWSPREAVERCEAFVELGVEFVEQPVKGHDLDGLRFVHERSPLPIIADESVRTSEDILRLAGCVDGINIKLAKCGGLLEAMTMIRLAHALGMRVMLGCMIESSIGIATMLQLAPLADDVDLDGNLLITNDPYEGPRLVDGVHVLTEAPGNGTRFRTGT